MDATNGLDFVRVYECHDADCHETSIIPLPGIPEPMLSGFGPGPEAAFTAYSGIIKVYFETDDWQRGPGFTARWGPNPGYLRLEPWEERYCGDGLRDNYREE